MKNYNHKNIVYTSHTFFRLSDRQKESFTPETMNEFLFEKTPVLVGIQYNGCYAVFYKYIRQRFIRIILDIRSDVIRVVTFYVIDKKQLPVIK